jgi:hypothetical protein
MNIDNGWQLKEIAIITQFILSLLSLDVISSNLLNHCQYYVLEAYPVF